MTTGPHIHFCILCTPLLVLVTATELELVLQLLVVSSSTSLVRLVSNLPLVECRVQLMPHVLRVI